jgi:hypothetical protein
MRRLLADVSALAAGVFMSVLQTSAQQSHSQVSGYVFGVAGTWGIAPQYVPPIVRGQELHADEVIRLAPSATASGFINIGLLDGSILVLDCSKQRDCKSATIHIPGVRQIPSLRDRATALFAHLFARGEPPVIFEMSRNGDSAIGPNEAVLRLDSQGVDFGSSLKNVAPGDYQLRATPVSRATKPGGERIECHWEPPDARCTGDHELAEGLYRLDVRRQTHTLGSTVPILIVRAEHYNQPAEIFGEFERVASGWANQARPETIHYLLSAVLFDLAQH